MIQYIDTRRVRATNSRRKILRIRIGSYPLTAHVGNGMVVFHYLGWFITATRDPRTLGCAGWESLDIREGCTKLKRSNALGTSALRAIYFPSFANNEVNSGCERIITSSATPFPILSMSDIFIKTVALISIKHFVDDPVKTLFVNINNWLWKPLNGIYFMYVISTPFRFYSSTFRRSISLRVFSGKDLFPCTNIHSTSSVWYTLPTRMI